LKKFGDQYQFLNNLLAVSTSGQEYFITYSESNYDKAKEALLGHIALIEKIIGASKESEKYSWEKQFPMELVVAYARLSLLAEKNNKLEESKEYMSKAVAICQKAGWKDYSEDRIRKMINYLDEHYKIPVQKPHGF